MVIKNPTDENLEFWYSGEQMTLTPGQRVRVDDARGNHAISELGRRGLIRLEYGDETSGVEEKKSAAGRQENINFKRKQVSDFNQEQERRLQRKLPINEVPEHVKKYADQLGLKLYEPFTQTDDFTREKAELINKLERAQDEIRGKDAAIESLGSQINELRDLMRSVIAAQGAPAETAPQSLESMTAEQEEEQLNKIKSLNRASFKNWLNANRDQIDLFPESIKTEVHARHQRFFGQPIEAAEATV